MTASSASDLNQALYSLRDILVTKKAKGAERVYLSPQSLDQLSALPTALMKMGVAAPPKPVEAVKATPQEPEKATPEPAAKIEAPESTAATIHSTPIVDTRGIEKLNPEGTTKREKLNNLFRLAKSCEACRKLGSLRDQVVFATGNPDAELMIVGEAPGSEEETQKKPFVGPAGQKLDGIITAMGLSREKIYISNIVKYRPMIGDGRFQGPKNRKPTPEEMAASVKYVMAEIDVVKPKAIVALGGTAAEGLLDLGGSVSRMRGKFYDLGGTPVMVTYHPSYLLRAESDPDGGRPKKRMVWEDMLLVMEKMRLPISEKQRSFFT